VNNKLLIGLASYATGGKDTFCALLSKRLFERGVVAKRFALADALKEDLRPLLTSRCGIDPVTCVGAEKALIRSLMVEWGRIMRTKSQGQYWTNLLEEKIHSSSDYSVGIVTDARYSVYPKDEGYWLKQKMGGILVSIDRYIDCDGRQEYIESPNLDESINYPKLKAMADYHVNWQTVGIDKLDDLMPYVDEFIDYLDKNNRLVK
jgi:hypothetical protein